jgi:hypothetical protein
VLTGVIVAVQFLSDCEQTRPHHRPYTERYFHDLYTEWYFDDLVEQLNEFARHAQATKEKEEEGEELEEATNLEP